MQGLFVIFMSFKYIKIGIIPNDTTPIYLEINYFLNHTNLISYYLLASAYIFCAK